MMKYTSTHQVYIKIYIQKLIKCFTNYIPFIIIPNVLNEKDIDLVIEEIFDTEDFQKQILK